MRYAFWKWILFLFGLFITETGFGQEIVPGFITSDGHIWYLNTKGEVKLFNLEGEYVSEMQSVFPDTVYFITKDRMGIPVIVDSKKEMRKYDHTRDKWDVIARLKDMPLGILFDIHNNCFVISRKGILDLKNNEMFYSEASLNSQILFYKEWRRGKPSFLIDQDNRIWIGFAYGEWGGNLFVFDTLKKRFLFPELAGLRMELAPVVGFFKDAKYVYICSSNGHMTTSSTVYKVQDFKTSVVFKSHSNWEPVAKNSEELYYKEGEYIGAAVFNTFDDSFYFYTQNGLFKLSNQDFKNHRGWKKITGPAPDWSQFPLHVATDVLDMQCIGQERFVINTKKSGLGYFNGKKWFVIK